MTAFAYLWRYFSLYWLKPVDGVNDAANAAALSRQPWESPILEIGSGDGVFSFVMHGGSFRIGEDRYSQVDLSLHGDIYDTYRSSQPMARKTKADTAYGLGIDLKMSHLQKARETGLYRHLVLGRPEQLPMVSASFKTVFLYIFHGLSDYVQALAEARRLVRDDGRLLVLVFNNAVQPHFLCHRLSALCQRLRWHCLARYFNRLDGGRHAELGELLCKSLVDWRQLLARSGFRIISVHEQVRPTLWWLYDTQTRPFLRSLIRMNHRLAGLGLKVPVKGLWMLAFIPFLSLMYWLWGKPKVVSEEAQSSGSVFLSFVAETVSDEMSDSEFRL